MGIEYALVFYGLVLPIALILWLGLFGFIFWLLTEPLAYTSEKISFAISRGRQQSQEQSE